MNKFLFIVLSVVCASGHVLADQDLSGLTQELAKNQQDLVEAKANLNTAEVELEKRKNSLATVDELSRVMYSRDALKKLVESAQSRVDTTQAKINILQVKPQN